MSKPISTLPSSLEIQSGQVLSFPAIDDYWCNESRFSVIADIMPRRRFKLLIRFIHFMRLFKMVDGLFQKQLHPEVKRKPPIRAANSCHVGPNLCLRTQRNGCKPHPAAVIVGRLWRMSGFQTAGPVAYRWNTDRCLLPTAERPRWWRRSAPGCRCTFARRWSSRRRPTGIGSRPNQDRRPAVHQRSTMEDPEHFALN